MKFKSIKKHIIVITLVLVILPLLILGLFTSITNYTSTMAVVEESMSEVVYLSASRIEWELKAFSSISTEIGTNAELSDSDVSVERKKEILAEAAEYYGMTRGNLVGADGMGIDGNDYSQNEFFMEAMKGNTCVSEPLVSKVTGNLTIIIAAPLWENGEAGKTPVGCVYFVPDEAFLNDIMGEIKVSKDSTAYIIDSEGNTIADLDIEVVKNRENIEAIVDADPDANSGYVDLAAIHAKARAGEQGFADCSYEGHREFVAYAPISGTDGWAVIVCSPAVDFLVDTYNSIVMTIFLFILGVVVASISASAIGRQIGDPIKICTDRIALLAQGDVNSPVAEIHNVDETGILAEATKALVGNLSAIISDITRILTEMANGNFEVHSQCTDEQYCGDFHALIDSVRQINRRLSRTLSQINTSADQVASGSGQVSGGAQALSQGATEQASSIQELAATLRVIADKVEETSRNCDNGNGIVEETVVYVNTAADDMNKLTEAMQEITDASNEINKIIKAIEDIAFQTNILALNAAVEAARAGEAGKGFAVVADEVRNLAAKSAEAARDTTVLIEKAINAIEHGTKIADETANAVRNVEERAARVNEIVSDIARASEEQTDMIRQVSVGVDQISGVVQNNSATAEESAAASEELSGQALMLKQLVSAFTFRKE